jgi:hypothetical protein
MDERYDENGNLKERFVDNKNGIEYVLQGDYYIPNIIVPSNIKNFRLGKYGRLRFNYLKTNKKAEYMILQMENKLQKHLMNVDITATNRVNAIIKELAKKENVTEELKVNNQQEWVRKDE